MIEAKEQNLVIQVRRIRPQSKLSGNTGLTFQQNESLIHLPSSLFDDNSSVTIVSVIYETLAYILTNLNVSYGVEGENGDSNYSIAFLNGSKMISSSVKPLGSERFSEPVKIVLDHHVTVRCQYRLTTSRLLYQRLEPSAATVKDLRRARSRLAPRNISRP